jgi:hypothetical protein
MLRNDTATQIQVLTEARDTLLELGWCKGTYAKDAQGLLTSTTAPDVAEVCAWGAIDRSVKIMVGFDPEMPHSVDDLFIIAKLNVVVSKFTVERSIIRYNDAPNTTRDDVVRVFNQAITDLKRPGWWREIHDMLREIGFFFRNVVFVARNVFPT